MKHLLRQMHDLETSQEPRLAELKKEIVLLQNDNSKLRNKLKARKTLYLLTYLILKPNFCSTLRIS